MREDMAGPFSLKTARHGRHSTKKTACVSAVLSASPADHDLTVGDDVGDTGQIAVGDGIADGRAGRTFHRSADYNIGGPTRREDADIEAMGLRCVAGGDCNRLGGRHAAYRRDSADVTQHSTRDDTGAARRVGPKRQPGELTFLAHAPGGALRRAVIARRADFQRERGFVDHPVQVAVAHRDRSAADMGGDVRLQPRQNIVAADLTEARARDATGVDLGADAARAAPLRVAQRLILAVGEGVEDELRQN
jgi:hypothetical protein